VLLINAEGKLAFGALRLTVTHGWLVLVRARRRDSLRRAPIFTKLASDRISDGLGGFVIEAVAALTILLCLMYLRFSGRWNQTATMPGINYSILTGVSSASARYSSSFFFQKGGPLSAVPAILAVGAALMAAAGIFFFKEPASPLPPAQCGALHNRLLVLRR
jgi:transporter family protein